MKTAKKTRLQFLLKHLFSNPFQTPSQQGFSLIEVLVAVGIMGIVAAGTSSMIGNMFSDQGKLKFRLQVETTREEIRSYLSGTQSCTNSFVGNDLVVGSPNNVTQIFDGTAAPGNEVYNLTSYYGDRSIKIRSMSLAYLGDQLNRSGIAELSIVFMEADKQNSVDMIRTIRLKTEKDPAPSNKLRSCMGLAGASDGIWQRATSPLEDIYYMSGTAIPGKVGIGTQTPQALFHLSGDGAQQTMMDSYTGSGSLILRQAMGTVAAPTVTTNNTVLGDIAFSGYLGGGTGFAPNASVRIRAHAAEDFTTTQMGSSLSFETTLPGTLTTQEVMRLDGVGRIGIGTPIPVTKFDVRADSPATNFLDDVTMTSFTNGTDPSVVVNRARGTQAAPASVNAGDSLGNFIAGGFDGAGFVNAVSLTGVAETDFSTAVNASLRIATTMNGVSNEAMRITSNGRIGLGTTVPDANFSIVGTQAPVVVSPTVCLNCDLLNIQSASGNQIHLSDNPIDGFNLWAPNSFKIKMFDGVTTNHYTTFLPNGSVGIGTTAPLAKLHIEGNGVLLENPAANEVAQVVVRGSGGTGLLYSSLGLGRVGAPADVWGMTYRSDTGNFSIGFFPFGTTTMEMTQAGRVGVGTSTPGYKLDVAGDANIWTGLRVASGMFNVSNVGAVTAANGNFTVDAVGGIWTNSTLRIGAGSMAVDGGGNLFTTGGFGAACPTTPCKFAVDSNGNIFSQAGAGMVIGNDRMVLEPVSGNLSVYGQVWSGGVLLASDASLKKNVRTIDDALDLVLRMRGVRFDWIRDGRHDLGVVAQEMEEIIPEVVIANPVTGKKSVSYANLIGVLIEAMKTQHEQIEEIRSCKGTQEQSIAEMKAEIAQLRQENVNKQKEFDQMKARLDRLEELLLKK